MATFRELTYMVLDNLKISSKDSYYTEEHALFLLNEYRSYLLKQKYGNKKSSAPSQNTQRIKLELSEGFPFEPERQPGPFMKSDCVRSLIEVPHFFQWYDTSVYKDNTAMSSLTYISSERFKYVGENRFLPRIFYSAVLPDQKLYIRTNYIMAITELKEAWFDSVFQDAILTSELTDESDLDLLDRRFPLEDSLIPPLVQMTATALITSIYRPEDRVNNNADDLAGLAVKEQKQPLKDGQ